jgi:hypothetical protein
VSEPTDEDKEQAFMRYLFNSTDYFAAVREAGDTA